MLYILIIQNSQVLKSGGRAFMLIRMKVRVNGKVSGGSEEAQRKKLM